MLDHYVAQVRLLVDMLPEVASELDFAIKGGTAINLLYRDLPRLSVDIDLTWLPVTDRASSLNEADSDLKSYSLKYGKCVISITHLLLRILKEEA